MEFRRAAVLVPIQEDEQGVRSLVLIQRPEELPSHQGQVAFPGGGHDPGLDESLLATALREAQEEVGLDPRDVEVIGTLREYTTIASNYLVSAFVARIPTPYAFQPCPREVESVFQAPLAKFLVPERETFDWEYGTLIYTAPCVRVGRYVVWGLTLRIIDDLIKLMPEAV